MAAKRVSPVTSSNNRKQLQELNDEEYAQDVLKPERNAVAKRGIGGALVGGSGLAAGTQALNSASLPVAESAGGPAGVIGGLAAAGLTGVGSAMANSRLNAAQKRIALTKGAITEAKAKNAQAQNRKK